MAKLVLRQEAINDLSDIWEYTSETWSENQADQYYQAIQFACLDIANKPNIGRPYDEISSGVLGYSINKHIIFYREASPEEIEVVRILHERMDLKRHLK